MLGIKYANIKKQDLCNKTPDFSPASLVIIMSMWQLLSINEIFVTIVERRMKFCIIKEGRIIDLGEY